MKKLLSSPIYWALLISGIVILSMLLSCSSSSGKRMVPQKAATVQPANMDSMMDAKGYVKAKMTRMILPVGSNAYTPVAFSEIHYIDQMYRKGDMIRLDAALYRVDSMGFKPQYDFGIYLGEDDNLEIFDAQNHSYLGSASYKGSNLIPVLNQKYTWIK